MPQAGQTCPVGTCAEPFQIFGLGAGELFFRNRLSFGRQSFKVPQLGFPFFFRPSPKPHLPLSPEEFARVAVTITFAPCCRLF